MLQVRLQTHGWFLKVLSQVPYMYVGVCVWKHVYKSSDSNDIQIINTPAGTEEAANDAPTSYPRHSLFARIVPAKQK